MLLPLLNPSDGFRRDRSEVFSALPSLFPKPTHRSPNGLFRGVTLIGHSFSVLWIELIQNRVGRSLIVP